MWDHEGCLVGWGFGVELFDQKVVVWVEGKAEHEEVVEVDDPKDAGTEVIEEVVEEDAKSTEKAPAKEEKK